MPKVLLPITKLLNNSISVMQEVKGIVSSLFPPAKNFLIGWSKIKVMKRQSDLPRYYNAFKGVGF